MSTSGLLKTLAFHQSAQGKSGRMPELSVKLVNQILFREVRTAFIGVEGA